MCGTEHFSTIFGKKTQIGIFQFNLGGWGVNLAGSCTQKKGMYIYIFRYIYIYILYMYIFIYIYIYIYTTYYPYTGELVLNSKTQCYTLVVNVHVFLI